MGASQMTELYTDHKNLLYFKEAHKLTRRQARWFTLMQEYPLKIQHVPGKTLTVPDALSRSHQTDTTHDNEQHILLR